MPRRQLTTVKLKIEGRVDASRNPLSVFSIGRNGLKAVSAFVLSRNIRKKLM
jgi:hypothetical protein